MRKEGIERRPTWRLHGCWPVIGAVALTVGLGGCSSVPDAVNPVSWYDKTVDYFSGDKNAPAEQGEKPAPGADKPFPNLATVPDKPQVTPESDRQQIAQGLVADTERRKYAPEVGRQGAAVNVLGSGPATPTAQAPTPTAPSPVPALPPVSAAPTTPVKTAEAPMPAASAGPPPAPRMALEPPPMPKTAGSAPAAPAASASREVAPRFTRPVPPAGAAMPGTAEPFPTVVVSSSGVQGEQMAAAPASRGQGRQLAAPAASAMAKPAPAGGQANGSLKVATIQFAYGSASLDARDRAILRQVLRLQKERGGVIRVIGHASSRTANMDPVRHKMVNFQVSADRAQAVASALEEMGANPDTIVVAARSDADPVYYEFMPSGEAGNQRTEVYLDY